MPGPAAAQRPRSPQRAEGPPLLLQEGDSRPTQASLSPGPPGLQAQVFCHPDPWSPAGKPQPRLSPTSLSGLARGQSRAPSLSASLYKCASCRAPLMTGPPGCRDGWGGDLLWAPRPLGVLARRCCPWPPQYLGSPMKVGGWVWWLPPRGGLSLRVPPPWTKIRLLSLFPSLTPAEPHTS